ncbi:MAG: hypothetical protein ACP6KW_09635 [Candidatus Thorarchaeota archaeon]
MKARLKVEKQWLDLERRSMSKMREVYEKWEQETLKKAKEAKDLRSLREVFYQLGDRWEFGQATGAWLTHGEPLDTVGLVLRMPGFSEHKERYVLYAFMAYSKGLTSKFDHLGDKERIIVEKDTRNGTISCWSTSGHGSMDLYPTVLTKYGSLENALKECYLVAQPGDHALRIECPTGAGVRNSVLAKLWSIASGNTEFTLKPIDVLTSEDIEESLDFRFHRYAKAVIDLESIWRELSSGAVSRAKEAVLDRIPDHIESKDRKLLRRIEGLLHVLWFRPPVSQLGAVKMVYDELQAEPTPTEVQSVLIPYLGELVYSLNDVIEKAKYLKWKSVIDAQSFSESPIFKDLNLSNVAREAFAAALDDILHEHTLSYIGYPERATMKGKLMRVLFGFAVLPLRLISSFTQAVLGTLRRKTTADSDESVDLPDEASEDDVGISEELQE